jgi:hypothetical protein
MNGSNQVSQVSDHIWALGKVARLFNELLLASAQVFDDHASDLRDLASGE